MNKIITIVALQLSISMFSINAQDCGTDKLLPICGKPSDERPSCLFTTIEWDCTRPILPNITVTEHICHDTWKKFTPWGQFECVPDSSKTQTCQNIPNLCGMIEEGQCQTGPTQSCTMEGTTLSVNIACYNMPGGDPSQVAGGKRTLVQDSADCPKDEEEDPDKE